MTIATYASRFDGFSGEQFQILETSRPAQRRQDRRRRRSSSPTAAPCPLNYLMRKSGADWKIVDIYLDGTISELANRRAEFGAILKSGGPDALVVLADQTGRQIADRELIEALDEAASPATGGQAARAGRGHGGRGQRGRRKRLFSTKSIRPKISAPLPESELPQLAAELRQELIDAVSMTGGHLGAGLGVVELTVALHYLFDTPRDRLIWDVSHQAYPHKILTGRRNRIRHAPSAGRPIGLHPARGKRIRHVRSGALLDLDLRRSRHGRGARSRRRRQRRDLRHRRRRDERRHGL